MNIKDAILRLFKNLAHPAGILGTIVAIAIPFLIYLAPNIKHRETIRQLDINLPLPLFGIQFILGIVIFCFLSKDFREWLKGILPAKSVSIMTLVFAVAVSIFASVQIEARHRVKAMKASSCPLPRTCTTTTNPTPATRANSTTAP